MHLTNMSDTTKTAALFSSIPDVVTRFGNKLQFGENGNTEYSWSSYFQEKIVQVSFQITRTHDPTQLITIGKKYNELLCEAFLSNNIDTITRQNYISLIYRMMLHTRDIIDGKGEYTIFYILLSEWVHLAERLKTVHPVEKCKKMHENKIICIEKLIEQAVDSLVYLDGHNHPYGSWKDMKYFLNYLRSRRDISHSVTELPVFKYIIKIIVEQLAKDATGAKAPTLLAKWLPREKSKKFGWIAKHIACKYYSHWLINNGDAVTLKDDRKIILSNKYSERKCLTHYRQLIASINRTLNTVQIYQCGNMWRNIDFDNTVTSITMSRQKEAFQYRNKIGNILGDDTDRLICKANYESYIKKCMEGKAHIKGKRTSIIDLVRDALEIVDMELRMKRFDNNITEDDVHKTTKETINLQWKEGDRELKELENFIPLIDTSGSMEGEPLLAALGLGCRIAEHSKLGKRAITFSATPKWINLEDCETLIEKVERLATHNDWGMNTDIVAAMKLLLDACLEKEMTPDETSNLTLVILSDMQIDHADKNSNTMHSVIEDMFYEGGLRSKYATPFKMPHIVYWNLRSTTGFPVLSFINNVSTLSGFSPIVLNALMEKGHSGLKECTPWEMFKIQLANKRYAWINESLDKMDMFAADVMLKEEAENIQVENTEVKKGWWW